MTNETVASQKENGREDVGAAAVRAASTCGAGDRRPRNGTDNIPRGGSA